jgi:hypothetical protein
MHAEEPLYGPGGSPVKTNRVPDGRDVVRRTRVKNLADVN